MRKSPLELVMGLISDKHCHLCGVDSEMICPDCLLLHCLNTESRCYKCNKITDQNRVCKSCRSGSGLRRVWRLGLHKNNLRDLIADMKFNKRRHYARAFGEYLAEEVPYLPEDTVVTPLPTAPSRVRMRSFDHSVLMANSFAESRNLVQLNLLRRISQHDQIGLHKNERIKMMANSFEIIDTSGVSGKQILLIDDIITTGASVEAAAKVLRRAGAKTVDAAVIARHIYS